MKNYAANLSPLPLYDSSHIGDTIINGMKSLQQDKDKLKKTIYQLKELVHSAIQEDNELNEDTLIKLLFSRADVDFANREPLQAIPLSDGRAYTIRTTEVINNTSGQEQDTQDRGFDAASNPYLENQEFAQATLYCCKEFLEWVLERIEKPVYAYSCVTFPYETVYNFVKDLSATGLISGLCKSTTPQKRQSFTLPMFIDIENLAFFNRIPNNPIKGMMSIFALRQMLESWFMRIIGFRGVAPIDQLDIRSGKFQEIIRKGFKTNFRFKDRPVSFESIQSIYRWTQASIHWAYSTNVWLLWKAITYCERLFGATVELSALECYRTEAVKLCIEESKFIKAKKQKPTHTQKNDRPSERTIYFRNPDIGVEDNGNRIWEFDVDKNGLSRLERNVIIRKDP